MPVAVRLSLVCVLGSSLSASLLDELIESQSDGFIHTGAQGTGSLVVVVDSCLSLGVDVALWEISSLIVGFGPLVSLWLEYLFLWSVVVCWGFLDGIAILVNFLYLLSLYWSLELFILDVLGIEGLWLVDELQANDGLDLAHLAFNHIELILESEL